MRAAFLEQSTPNLTRALTDIAESGESAVVVPALLASAYHARVDMPAAIAASGADVVQADVLGEDPALISLLGRRLAERGVSPDDPSLGVVVVAVGSSSDVANARTAAVARSLHSGTAWAGAEAAFATGPAPGVAEAADRLRAKGARRLVIAPWFLAHGRITDGIANYAARAGIAMAEPLGAHRLVAATVLDRAEAALTANLAA